MVKNTLFELKLREKVRVNRTTFQEAFRVACATNTSHSVKIQDAKFYAVSQSKSYKALSVLNTKIGFIEYMDSSLYVFCDICINTSHYVNNAAYEYLLNRKGI